jgi:hypothetical protein
MKTLLLGFLLVGSACAQVAETGPARAERLLAAMGGRDAWAQVKFAYVEAVHDTVTLPAPYTNRIWNDFTAPRVRFEATNPQIDRRRVIDNGKGRLSREGVVTELTLEQIEDERRWWEANIYRTLHRLAVNDPDLTARAVGDNRLELFRADGKRLNWFVLTPRGEPMLFGTWDSENGSAFGPLASNGSINYPKWGAVPAGLWRYEIVKIVTSGTVPADVSFTTP